MHFTSTSGLIGNFGQANYAAAKLGIVGLSKSIALDMGRFNVRSNCVSPFAWTRMIGTIPTETEAEKARVEKIKQMGPEKIAPMCAYLLSDAAKDVTGQIFGVRMNEIFLFSQNRPLRSVQRERRLDAADHRRTRHAGAEGIVLQARPFRGHFPLGSDLSMTYEGGQRRAAPCPRLFATAESWMHAVWVPAFAGTTEISAPYPLFLSPAEIPLIVS